MLRWKIEVAHNVPYTYFVVEEIDLFSYLHNQVLYYC